MKRLIAICCILLCFATLAYAIHNTYDNTNFNRNNLTNISVIEAKNISANMTWTDNYNYPAACAANNAITALNDVPTCTDSWVNIDGDIMTGPLNVTKPIALQGDLTFMNSIPYIYVGNKTIIARISTTGIDDGGNTGAWRLRIGAGSLDGVPYAFGQDYDTGLFQNSTGNVGLVADGREVVRVNASGKTGFNCTTPPQEAGDFCGSVQASEEIRGKVAAATINGSMGWSNLTSYPDACHPGEAITALNDTITCTAVSTLFDNSSFVQHAGLEANISALDNDSIVREYNDTWKEQNVPFLRNHTKIEVDDINGTIGWTNLTSYPAECPANSAITLLNDSVTCTDAWIDATGDTVTGDYAIDGNANISNVTAGHVNTTTLNATSIIASIGKLVSALVGNILLYSDNAGTLYTNATGIMLADNTTLINESGLYIDGTQKYCDPRHGCIYPDNIFLSFGNDTDYRVMFNSTTGNFLLTDADNSVFLEIQDNGTSAVFTFNGQTIISPNGNVSIPGNATLGGLCLGPQCAKTFSEISNSTADLMNNLIANGSVYLNKPTNAIYDIYNYTKQDIKINTTSYVSVITMNFEADKHIDIECTLLGNTSSTVEGNTMRVDIEGAKHSVTSIESFATSSSDNAVCSGQDSFVECLNAGGPQVLAPIRIVSFIDSNSAGRFNFSLHSENEGVNYNMIVNGSACRGIVK